MPGDEIWSCDIWRKNRFHTLTLADCWAEEELEGICERDSGKTWNSLKASLVHSREKFKCVAFQTDLYRRSVADFDSFLSCLLTWLMHIACCDFLEHQYLSESDRTRDTFDIEIELLKLRFYYWYSKEINDSFDELFCTSTT